MRVCLRLLPCSSRKLAFPVRASWRLPCKPQSVQVRGCAGKHFPSECHNHRRVALTSTLHHPSAAHTDENAHPLIVDSAFATHRATAGSLLDQQSELRCGSGADHDQCRCVVVVASTLHASAAQTNGHAHLYYVRLRLAPCSSRKLAPLVEACFVTALVQTTIRTSAWS